MTGATLFSGIGAPETAMPWVSWKFCAEIEPFPSAVIAHRHPGIPNLGDVTHADFIERAKRLGPIDLIVFGSPCQSFSVAGKRLGLDDPRGNLALIALGIIAQLRPTWFLFENVPGLLSSESGRDFGAFVGTLGQLGYGWAYRILDAQYFGVPQRRRRIFLVGHSGDWRAPAAVLFEQESLRRDSAPSREAGEETAGTIGRGSEGGRTTDSGAFVPVSLCLNAKGGAGRMDGESETFIPVCAPLTSANHYGVRRLTAREWERLMGLSDDYTLVPYRGKLAADGPRYKAIGNSIAIPPLAWIGRRILAVSESLYRIAVRGRGGCE